LLFRKYKEKANAQEKVIFGGRLANYQYYDMDQVFGAALKAVAKEFGEMAN
ncbi:UDP-galactopyranose mutase, partial [Enterococcus faecalis]